MCRANYHNDRLKLSKINEFETKYQSEQSTVRCYTDDSFLYRLRNEILRTETIDSIFKFRYFIQDLHNCLAFMQVDYLKRLQRFNSPILTLYRGQISY
jgi:hypothetical protein